jgi:serine O-acetyltransferase
MSEDIALLVVRLCGGFWRYRERVLRCRPGSFASRILRAIYYLYLQRYGAYIGHSARFAAEPCFPHNLNGIFVAGNARIGRNCILFQQVTIGANALPDSKGVGTPTIGDDVYIGAGAKIIGGVKIGNNCRIGANCVVSFDVPDNSIVVLPRATTLVRDNVLNNRYYRWSPQGPIYFDNGKWILEADPTVVAALKQAL